MWKWLSRLLGTPKASATDPYAEKLVPDEEYQFKFGTKPIWMGCSHSVLRRTCGPSDTRNPFLDS
mgnify:CR=1 FL=1